mmetsp:Transcript_110256/g.299083  ORF Transcript_110256/g.299083 Transcript_110256/m.299083 type:complete len:607 (+) Transcript_110256:2-1822(+)
MAAPSGQPRTGPSKNFWLWGNWGKRAIKQPFLTEKIHGRIRDIVLGSGFIIALKEDGTLVSWGEDKHGCLGLGADQGTCLNPMAISFPSTEHRDTCKIISIQFGHRHVLALSDRGKVFSWGDNGQGQLGLSDIQTRYEPNFVEELRNEAVKQIVAVGNMSYALTSKGTVYAWGENDKGMLALEHEVKALKPEPMHRMINEKYPVRRLEVKECQGVSGGKAGKTIIAFVEMAEPLTAKDYPGGFAFSLDEPGHGAKGSHGGAEALHASVEATTDRDKDIFEGVDLMRHVMDNTQEWWKHMLEVRHGSPYIDEDNTFDRQHSGSAAASIGEEDQVRAWQQDFYEPLERLETASLELSMLLESAKAQLSEIRSKKGTKNVKFLLSMFIDDCKLRREKIRRTMCARQLVEHKKGLNSMGDAASVSMDTSGRIAQLDGSSQQLTKMLKNVRSLPTEDDFLNCALRDSLAECLECKLQVNAAARDSLSMSRHEVNPVLPALRIIKERWAELKRFSICSMYKELMLRGNIAFDSDEEMLAFLVQSSNAKISQIISIDEHAEISRSALVPAICYDLLKENAELRKMCNTYQLKVLQMKDRDREVAAKGVLALAG